MPGGIKLLDLPAGSLVTLTGEKQDVLYKGVSTTWVELSALTSQKVYVGWMYQPFVEPYAEEFPPAVVSIPHATPDQIDAAQYMLWRGIKQFNLCGELCVCYITGSDIDSMLTNWQAKAVNVFKNVFGDGRARGTDVGELDSMLMFAFGYSVPSLRLDAGLSDPILGRPLVTPGRFAQQLSGHRAIVSVHIDSVTGNLRGSGILHWVVVESVIPDGVNRGWVELYNPFPNRMQRYSWNEFINSMGSPYGVLVAR